MPADDRSARRLQAALEELAEADVAELIADARAEARAQVRALLSEALEEAMLERASAQLEQRARPTAAARPAPAPVAPATTPAPTAPAWYVYGVIDDSERVTARELSGVRGGEVTTITDGELAAVVSRVERDEFEEARLRANLADMAWVEAMARAHEGVLDALCHRTTVIPMRMCTVYKDRDGVGEMLEREGAVLRDALDHLDGKREWGVQALFSHARAQPPEDLAGGEPVSGADYMRRRAQQRELDEQLEQVVEEAVREIHECVKAVSVEGILNSPQRSEASGRQGQMVLNGVYLVDEQRQEAFEEEVRSLQQRFAPAGLELVMTGPWPPYNFIPGSIGAAW